MKPPKQTKQFSLWKVKWSLFLNKIQFLNHFNLSKINEKKTFISETGAQGFIIWDGEGGGSESLRNRVNFYNFSASRCQTWLPSWEYFSCSSWKGGRSSDREAGELDPIYW